MKVKLPHDPFRLALAVAALMLLTLTAAAHTTTQLDDWRNSWVQQADTSLSATLLAEWDDMRSRHPTYFYTPEDRSYDHVHAVVRSSTGMGSGGAEVERWRPLVAVYFPAQDVELALCIINAESGGNPDAKNPNSSASGLFQHLARYWPERSTAAGWGGASIWNPEANTAVAAWLAATGGWSHWTTYGGCK